MNQVRAALAIAIAIYSIKFIYESNIKRYTCYILLASSIHFSILLALPLYWYSHLKINKYYICVLLAVAFLIEYNYGFEMKSFLQRICFRYNFISDYTSDSSEYSSGLGLMNPVIYYQSLILLVYTFSERKLSANRLYYIYRNLYFFSTIVLILLSNFEVLSGRLSTIYATLEIFIIPSMLSIVRTNPLYKFLAWSVIVSIASIIFQLNVIKYFNCG